MLFIKKIKKNVLVCILSVIIMLSSALTIVWPYRWLAIISTSATFLLLVIFYMLNCITNFFLKISKRRKICPYYVQTDCPYDTSMEPCGFDTAFCLHVHSNNTSSRHTVAIIFLLIFSIICSATQVLLDAGVLGIEHNPMDKYVILRMLSPIANSIIAAVVCTIVMDIPARMKEYQKYFIGLLSSSDYLKSLSEDDLSKLRNMATMQLHTKDVPNMPKGLIDLDNKILAMLKKPYFKSYTQIIHVEKGDTGFLKKTIKVDYVAHNPYSKEHPIKMDIGFASSLKYNKDIDEEQSRSIFKIKKFFITFDDKIDQVDFRSYIKVQYAHREYKGLQYNGVIQIASNESGDCIDLSINKNDRDNFGQVHIPFEEFDGKEKPFYVRFSDKIHVSYEYELQVPEDDISSTKRLRYPVKYFYQDYSISRDLKYKLVGQLIGTLIDQDSVSIDNLDDGHRISIRTRNWLLPKNGTMIVHSKISDNN